MIKTVDKHGLQLFLLDSSLKSHVKQRRHDVIIDIYSEIISKQILNRNLKKDCRL